MPVNNVFDRLLTRVALAGAVALPLVTTAFAQTAAPVPPVPPAPAPAQSVQAAVPARPAAAPAVTQGAAPASEAAMQPVDLSRYSCQDLMVDMLNKQLERINLTVTISWGLARTKDDPTNARLDFAQLKPLNEAVWKNCALGERARHVRDVVADEIKLVRTSS